MKRTKCSISISNANEKKGDDLKIFEKRIRQNEQTVKKVHDLNKKSRLKRDRISSRFEKGFRSNKFEFSKNIIQKIMNRFAKKNESQRLRFKNIDISRKFTKTNENPSSKKKRLRFCKFCGGSH